jgi:hypothetical protein
MRGIAFTLLALGLVLFLGSPVGADEPGLGTHIAVPGTVSKIRSGMLFVEIPVGLRTRPISPNKADRLGLHEAKIGDEVTLEVDEGNVLVDVHKKGTPAAGHRILMGILHYADQYWQEIKLSTPEGIEGFEVDTLAGSKLSVFQEGAPVRVELDEDNMVIDIHRAR